MKTANLKQRLKALLIDYLCILAYLILLALVIGSIYFFLLDGIPAFTETQSHWLAFLTTILPVVLYFSIREARAPYTTIGKEKVGLTVNHSLQPFLGSLLRNSFKFLPWHLGHYSVIRGMYAEDFLRSDVLIPYVAALVLPIVYIAMVGFREKHQHLPDLIARTQVIIAKEKD
jgi:uncharacterized RDD family membrane protein YckC